MLRASSLLPRVPERGVAFSKRKRQARRLFSQHPPVLALFFMPSRATGDIVSRLKLFWRQTQP
jgi:hypothetical protein